MKKPKMPKNHGGSLIKKTSDLTPHPYYKPGSLPNMSGNHVRDMGLVDNPNAPTRGGMNHGMAGMGEMKKKMGKMPMSHKE